MQALALHLQFAFSPLPLLRLFHVSEAFREKLDDEAESEAGNAKLQFKISYFSINPKLV